LKFFLPYWEDWVHGDFDPISDTYTGGFENSLFAHEIFDSPPYDGILLSLGLFEFKLKLLKINGQPTIRGYRKIRDYLRLNSQPEIPVMGDCGAFTYVNEKFPLISVDEAIKIYSKLSFDYGISVDHICSEWVTVEKGKEEKFSFTEKKENRNGLKIKLSKEELEWRRKLSLENAEEFYRKANGFHPIGAAQGYSISSYVESVGNLIDIGYDFVALGGLVPRETSFIAELLKELHKKGLLKKARFHLLGVLREGLLPLMKELGIYSFDSASYFRKAWLKVTSNYYGVDGKWYSSIRVPDCKNKRLLNKIKEIPVNIEKKERKILQGLREYDEGKLKNWEGLLEDVISYDKLFFRNEFNEEKYKKLYSELLESKIWKRCNCPICRELGIDVVIFRGSNRNKRRGFHNTYVFYYNTFVSKNFTRAVRR
jgi:hypothetical protein